MDLSTWFAAAGLPEPRSVAPLGEGWLVTFGPEVGLPEVEVAPVPSGPVSGPEHAIVGLRLALAAGVPAPPDARVLRLGGDALLATSHLSGPSGVDLLRAGRGDVVGAAVGRTLARLAAARGPEGDVPAGQGFVSSGGRVARAERAAAHAVASGRDPGAWTDALVALCAQAGPAPEPSLVHGRFGPAALRFVDGEPHVVGWGWAHVGDPCDDLAEVLLLDPAPRARVVDAAGGWPPGGGLEVRLRAGLAMGALTHPDRALARVMAEHALRGDLTGPVRRPDPTLALTLALWDRLARFPTLAGPWLVSWLGAAACRSLARERPSIRARLVRLGLGMLSEAGGSLAVRSDTPGALAEHPASGLVASVVDEATPRAARAGAAALCRTDPGLDHEGGRLLLDLLSGTEAGLGRVRAAASAMGATGLAGDLEPAVTALAQVDALPRDQHAAPAVLHALSVLGRRAAPIDPEALLFRMFGPLGGPA